MAQKHPYCRTCGSHIHSRNVCSYCGCEPLNGHNYCCDCGTSTIAGAIMCVHCGASFQRKFPTTLAILISIAFAVTIAGAGYFITKSGNEPSEKSSDTINEKKSNDSTRIYKLSPKKDETVKIINNIPSNLLNKRNNAIIQLINNLPKNPKPEREIDTKPVTQPKNKEEVVTVPEKTTTTTSGRVSMNIFSSWEMRNYSVGCTYFEGRSKNNVVFFTTNVYGYVKINGKVYALQGVQKGNDIARFAGAGYEVTVEILGLAGNEKEWLAEATMAVTDVRQKTISRHKIYSTCTDF